jgi:hypothetical protein
MVQHFGNLLDHHHLDFIEVLNQRYNELVANVEQLQGQLLLRKLLAVENV